MNKVEYGNALDIDIFNDVQEDYKDPELLALIEGTINNKSYNVDLYDNVKGVISSITKDEILLQINDKECAYIDIKKDKLSEEYQVGDEVEAMITELPVNGSHIKASITEKIKNDLYKDMLDYKSKTVYDAKVTGLSSNNGYELLIDGVKVFMPGSLGGINRLTDFESLLGKTIKVMSIKNNNSYSKYNKELIVSHREYLKSLIPNEIEKLVIGNTYTGRVTDVAKFGIFVEFNDVLTGLIHKDEFDDIIAEHFNKKEIVPGTEVVFYLKEVVSNNRIILSRLKPDERRESKREKYKVDDIVKGKVTHIAKYGAFVKFDKNKSGLLHNSNMKGLELEVDQKLECKILNINSGKYDLGIS